MPEPPRADPRRRRFRLPRVDSRAGGNSSPLASPRKTLSRAFTCLARSSTDSRLDEGLLQAPAFRRVNQELARPEALTQEGCHTFMAVEPVPPRALPLKCSATEPGRPARASVFRS